MLTKGCMNMMNENTKNTQTMLTRSCSVSLASFREFARWICRSFLARAASCNSCSSFNLACNFSSCKSPVTVNKLTLLPAKTSSHRWSASINAWPNYGWGRWGFNLLGWIPQASLISRACWMNGWSGWMGLKYWPFSQARLNGDESPIGKIQPDHPFIQHTLNILRGHLGLWVACFTFGD